MGLLTDCFASNPPSPYSAAAAPAPSKPSTSIAGDVGKLVVGGQEYGCGEGEFVMMSELGQSRTSTIVRRGDPKLLKPQLDAHFCTPCRVQHTCHICAHVGNPGDTSTRAYHTFWLFDAFLSGRIRLPGTADEQVLGASAQ